MNDPNLIDRTSQNTNLTYQISVQGHLDKVWSGRLAGMVIDHFNSNNISLSTLTGNIQDQAELLGVLNTLNDFHFTILNVNRIS